jgi:dynein heavy chain
MLKKYGQSLDEYEMKLLQEGEVKWGETESRVYQVKETVNALQNAEVDKIKQKVEDFDFELIQFRKLFRAKAPFNYNVSVNTAFDLIYDFHHRINAMEEKAGKLVDLERVFELAPSKHREIKKNRSDNKLLKQIWDMVSLVKHQFDDWKKTQWDNIDTDMLQMSCKKINSQLTQMPKEVRNWKVYIGLGEEVKNLLTVLPLISALHSPAMEDRHWAELKVATGRNFTKGPQFCLSDVLDLELHKYVQQVEYLVDLATKEAKIQGSLGKIATTWGQLQLQFGTHAKKGEPVAIIVQSEEILTALEDNMSDLQGMQGQGSYVEHFIDEVNRWQKMLGNTEVVISDWLEVQLAWQNLEAIFLGSKDIRVQLPEDSRRFDGIDANWRGLMQSAQSNPMVLEACSVEGRDTLLQSMKAGLELCNKSLSQYLEMKRKAFPRFYFLAGAAMLDILSNGYNPQAVQKHLGDCFDNVAKLTYKKDDNGEFTKVATSMHSKDGEEEVPFFEDFEATGAVEDWLNRLVTMMRDTLRDILTKAKNSADHWDLEKR